MKSRPTRRMSGSKCGLVMRVTAWPRRRRASPRPTKGWTSPALPTGMSRAFKRAFLCRIGTPARSASEGTSRPSLALRAGVDQPGHGATSGHQFVDRCPPGDQMERPIEAVTQFQVGGDAEAVVDRRHDVGGGDGIAARLGADTVAGTMHVTALDAAA